ncbi:MAG: porin family protein [Balneolaceae bacterium]|nr:porin family protein [Balneolaceae bacterium]
MKIKLLAGSLILVLNLVFIADIHSQQKELVFGILEDSYGVKGGLYLSSILGDDAETNSFRSGIHAGIFYSKVLGDKIALQPELLYSKKGGESRIRQTSGALLIQNFELSYLEVPLLLKYIVPTSGGSRVNLFAGPSVGFLLDQDTENLITGSTVTLDELSSVEWGILAGAGLDVRYSSKLIIIEARVGYGLNSVDDTGQGLDLHNFFIGLSTGIGFQ